MKKILIFVLIIIVCFRLVYVSNEEEMRVRIIPNSNSSKDLEDKEEIKDIVICYLNEMYDGSYEQYFENINLTYKNLERILSEKYEISISFDKHTLYNKTYNNTMIKNNEYYTLYIIIGCGNGDNWWGSIYPDFLGISGDCEVEYKSLFVELLKNIKEN